jgi:hypothetical protein
MAELYGLLRTKNSEIRAAFFRLAIAAEDTSVLPAVLEMLTTQGRMKFLRYNRTIAELRQNNSQSMQRRAEACMSCMYHGTGGQAVGCFTSRKPG